MSTPNHADTVVLIVDVQTGLFTTDPPPWEADAVLARINQVTSMARARGVPVFFVRQDGDAEDDLVPGTAGWELDRRIQVAPGDLHLRKTTCDAFYATSLEQELKGRGVNKLVIAGYATEFCLDSTVRSASSKGFEVVVVEDGHTTNDSPIMPAKQIVRFHNWAWPNASNPRNIAVVKVSGIDRVLDSSH